MKKIEAVKPTTSNGSHVETSSNISRSSRIAPLHNAKVPSSFPGGSGGGGGSVASVFAAPTA